MKSFIIVCLVSVLLIPESDVTINKNLKVNGSTFSYKGIRNNSTLHCGDKIKGDTINIFMGKGRYAGYFFNLSLIRNEKKISIRQWSDYPQFDGQSSVKLPVERYKLTINKNNFKTGDTLKAKFFVVTEENKFSKKMKFKGEIYHIIGGNLFGWSEGHSDKNERYINGFPLRQKEVDSL